MNTSRGNRISLYDIVSIGNVSEESEESEEKHKQRSMQYGSIDYESSLKISQKS